MTIMVQFFRILVLTTLAIFTIYYSHHFLTYGYHTYCNGIALGTPPCNYVLELMYLSAFAVKSYWIYLGTIFTSMFIYFINSLYQKLDEVTTKLNQTQEQIKKHQLVNLH